MSQDDPEPPSRVAYTLDEALELLATLQDARAVLMESDYLAGVLGIEDQIRLLSHRLGFDDPNGGSDGV